MSGRVVILGIYVTDLAFRASRMPMIGETLAGSAFAMGPGGKGSNQSVAAARVGGAVTFISKIGKDAFGDIALATWQREGIKAEVTQSANARPAPPTSSSSTRPARTPSSSSPARRQPSRRATSRMPLTRSAEPACS